MDVKKMCSMMIKMGLNITIEELLDSVMSNNHYSLGMKWHANDFKDNLEEAKAKYGIQDKDTMEEALEKINN